MISPTLQKYFVVIAFCDYSTISAALEYPPENHEIRSIHFIYDPILVSRQHEHAHATPRHTAPSTPSNLSLLVEIKLVVVLRALDLA